MFVLFILSLSDVNVKNKAAILLVLIAMLFSSYSYFKQIIRWCFVNNLFARPDVLDDFSTLQDFLKDALLHIIYQFLHDSTQLCI